MRQQIGGAFIAARAIFTRSVVAELIGGGSSKEVGFRSKDLGVEQFGFDGGVDAFHIIVGIGTGWRIEAVLGLIFLFDGRVETPRLVMDGVAVELNAQIGGEDDLSGV